MTKILGLDLGTNSIGWAVVGTENNRAFELQEKGVHIFQEGVKIEKGIEGSKAAERTEHRSARRLKFRRKLRKYHTLKVLIEYDMCPLDIEELKRWRNFKNPESGKNETFKHYPKSKAFLDWQMTRDEKNGEKKVNPYYYRHLAASKKLDLDNQMNRYLLGRAFYHMAQRRGFLSNRLDTTKESDGIVKQAIDEISKHIKERTLGQYFYEKYLMGEKIRNQYTHREVHYLKEFETVCKVQQLPDELVESLKKAIFYQRPLKSQKGLVGKCPFERNKPRCAVSHPDFEEYRMLCFVNNMKIKTPEDEKLRQLNEDERKKVIQRFYLKRDHFDFEDLAKQLAPNKQYRFYKDRNKSQEDCLFNYDMKTTVSGCPVSARFRSTLGKAWKDLKLEYSREKDNKVSNINIHDVWHVLFTFDSGQKLKEFAQHRLGLNEIQTEEFSSIKLKRDYASLSLKAIHNILPYLREGLIYSHAVFLAKMKDIIPEETWEKESNRKIIREEIKHLIQSQYQERQIIEIVNGLIKTCRENNWNWSAEGEQGFRDDLMARLREFFGENKWSSIHGDKQTKIIDDAFGLFKSQMKKGNGMGEFIVVRRIDERIKDFIMDHFNVSAEQLKNLYHPSDLDLYKPPVKGGDGREYLGSPMVSSVRNPMAMRSLHQLRSLINELIRQDIVDASTKIHIEMARDLKNANERKALQSWQRDRESKRKEFSARIMDHFNKAGINNDLSDEDILKYQLWEEQNHKCIYTGKEINISDFLGSNPLYDIEHTIPRSLSFDNSQENKTLCENRFNREIKKNKIPYELANHAEILGRIEHWRERFLELEKQINAQVKKSKGASTKDIKDRAIQRRHQLIIECNYWKEKYRRFEMKDVPEGFKNSQLVDTGIITRYARLYLKTLFDKVYTVKGNTVADFRRHWGLQDEYAKKERVNHIHHCIDAITIACITKQSYESLAKSYHDSEDCFTKGSDKKIKMAQPWESFAYDVRKIEQEVLVSHHTPDVLPKQSKKKLRKRGKIKYNKKGTPIYQQGDTVRGSLHKETFYGAIAHDIKGKVLRDEEKRIIPKYVVRKPLDRLETSDIEKIVDKRIRMIIKEDRGKEIALKKEKEALKRQLNNAEENEEASIREKMDVLNKKIEELYALPNKNGNPIPIRKVRIYQPTITNPLRLKAHRDKTQKSAKPYKEHFHAANDGNYMMAIYEGKDDKGKTIRDFELRSNIKAGEYFKYSVQKDLKPQGFRYLEGMVPNYKMKGKTHLPLKCILKVGTMVLLYENEPEEVWDLSNEQLSNCLYKIIGLSEQVIQGKYRYGTITMRFNKEGRPSTELKVLDGAFKIKTKPFGLRKMNQNQFNALVDGFDFNLNILGQIEKINN